MQKITVGLFGTCGQSTWRQKFIEKFNEDSVNFYNPQLGEGEWVADRADEFVQIENWNLKNNELILFPITDETTGQGSLAEIGFSVADTIRQIKKEVVLKERYLIVFIDPECNDPKANNAQIEESKRSRKLVLTKCIKEAEINNRVFVVESLEEMLALSVDINLHFENKEQDNHLLYQA